MFLPLFFVDGGCAAIRSSSINSFCLRGVLRKPVGVQRNMNGKMNANINAKWHKNR